MDLAKSTTQKTCDGDTGVSPRPHRVTARGAESSEKILQAALAILHEGGYAALSISTICKRAGVSAASLYHHFGDKAGLINAMARKVVDDSAAFLSARAATSDKILEQIGIFIESLRQVRRRERYNTSGVLMALSQARGDSPETEQTILKAQRYVRTVIAERLAAFLGVEDASLMAHMQVAFTSYVAQLGHSDAARADVDEVYDGLRRLMIILAAAYRPDLASDPDFAAALAAAAQATETA